MNGQWLCCVGGRDRQRHVYSGAVHWAGHGQRGKYDSVRSGGSDLAEGRNQRRCKTIDGREDSNT